MSEAAERLAAALRGVIDHAVTADLPPADLAHAIAALEDLDARLAAHPRRAPKGLKLPDVRDPHAGFPVDPVVGLANPIAPPVRCEVRDGVVVGRAVYGTAHEGPPGYVHGGVIAAAFDQILGIAQLAGGYAAMTGTLTVRYRHPTPLHTEVRFEARATGAEGRKVFARATLHWEQTLCAEGEAVFVSPGVERAAELFPRGE